MTVKEIGRCDTRYATIFTPSQVSRMTSDEIHQLQDQIGQLTVRLDKAERELAEAKGEAHEARERVLELRDHIAAAQRDQQDLRTARARLRRFAERGFFARLLNRD